MRITENVEKIVFVQEEKGIICNCCGNLFEPNSNEFHSVQQLNLSFGYESRFDNQKWTLDICEECLLQFIKKCKNVPDNFMSDPYHISSFDTDSELHQSLFEEWKISDEWNSNEENPYEDYYLEENQNMDDRKPLLQATLKIVK